MKKERGSAHWKRQAMDIERDGVASMVFLCAYVAPNFQYKGGFDHPEEYDRLMLFRPDGLPPDYKDVWWEGQYEGNNERCLAAWFLYWMARDAEREASR